MAAQAVHVAPYVSVAFAVAFVIASLPLLVSVVS